MSQVQSWQIQCRKCGWANSGAEVRCGKCGFPLPHRPGMLVAGQSLASSISSAPRLKVAQPAGFWVRFVAFIIDWAILEAVAITVYFVWKGTLTPAQIDPNHLAASLQSNAAIQAAIYELAVSLVFLFYFVGSWTILGASPAQRIFNLHIIGKDGEPVGFWRAWWRYILLSWFAFPSIFFVAFSKSKRGIHDHLAGTYVIQYLDPERIEGHPGQQLPPGLVPPPTGVDSRPGQAPLGPNPSPLPSATVAGAGPEMAATPAPILQLEPAGPQGAGGSALSMAVAAPALVSAALTPVGHAAPPVLQPAPATAPGVLQAPVGTRAPVPPPAFPGPGPQVSGVVAALAPVPMAPAIEPVPPQAFVPPSVQSPMAPAMAPSTYSPPPAGATPETAGGREIYSPNPGPVLAPPTIDPYPLPFTVVPPEMPAVAPPPPRPAEQEPPPA